jgi:hypothetical protein
LLKVEVESVPHVRGGPLYVVHNPRRADERERFLTHGPRVVSVPLLALLADVKSVEEIGTGAFEVDVTDGPEVRDGHALDGRLRQKEVANGDMNGLGEALDLLERGLLLVTFPAL